MTHPVTTRVGSLKLTALPNRLPDLIAEVKAIKTPTVKAARAAVLRKADKRAYPKFKEGMSTAEYVRAYTMLNARATGNGIRTGPFLTGTDVHREDAWIKDFFQPLSTLPQFSQEDLTIEESM